jgi:hypothetical protein
MQYQITKSSPYKLHTLETSSDPSSITWPLMLSNNIKYWLKIWYQWWDHVNPIMNFQVPPRQDISLAAENLLALT